MKKEVERDRSKVTISEISSLGLMEITRERVCNNYSFILNALVSLLKFWLIIP
jgi:Ribonuclease G/E